MAYSPQPSVAVDTNYWSGNARLDQETGRRHYAADPLPQLAALGASSVALHSALINSTEHLVDAIARESQVTILRYAQANESV